MEAEVLKLMLESWPQGVTLIVIVYFVNRFFGWLAPLAELYVKAQVQWGETSTRTLAEMNELMRIVDVRLAQLESHIMGIESEQTTRARPKKTA